MNNLIEIQRKLELSQKHIKEALEAIKLINEGDQEQEVIKDQIPVDVIKDAYNHHLGDIAPLCVKLTTGRKRLIIARWKDSKKHQDIKFWNKFFNACRQLEWMFHDKNGSPTAWINIEWLLNETNFYKTIERLQAIYQLKAV